jgi:hypothetical protein
MASKLQSMNESNVNPAKVETPAAKKPTSKKTARKAPRQVPTPEADVSTKNKGRSKPLSLYVTPETWRALQFQKIDEARTMNDIINDAIDAYLSTVGGPEKK